MTLIESEIPALLISTDSTQIHGSSATVSQTVWTVYSFFNLDFLLIMSLRVVLIFPLFSQTVGCRPCSLPSIVLFNWNKLLQQSEHQPHLYPGKCNQTKPDFPHKRLSSRASSAGVHGVNDRPISLKLSLMLKACVHLLSQNYEITCPRGVNTVFLILILVNIALILVFA